MILESYIMYYYVLVRVFNEVMNNDIQTGERRVYKEFGVFRRLEYSIYATTTHRVNFRTNK